MPGSSPVWPGLLLGALTVAWWIGVGVPDASYWSFLLTAAVGLGIAAIGQTFVLASGSQGLGGGAMIALVNVLVVTQMGAGTASMAAWIVAGPLLGAAVGAVNGYLVGYRGLSSVAVTLATSMVVYGATLFFLDTTAPPAPDAFMRLVIGDAIPGAVPAPLVILAAVGVVAAAILRSPLGALLYAVGRDREAARRAGLPVDFARMIAHVLAGAGYGLAGVAVAGVTGSADPLIGAPTVLQIYAAVAIGGIGVGGGRGGALGAILGTLVVASVVGVFFMVDVDAYWSTAVEGGLLVGGLVLSRSFFPGVPAAAFRRDLMVRLRGGQVATGAAIAARSPPSWRRLVPVLAALGVVIIATGMAHSVAFEPRNYIGYLMASAILLAILATGQAIVLATGAIDISLPATMALSASVFAAIVGGSDRFALVGIPVALGLAGLVGAINGGLIAVLGVRALFVTLAMTGVLQAVIIDTNLATTERFVSAAITTLLTGSLSGVPILAFLLVGFAAIVAVAIDGSALGRGVRALGRRPGAPLTTGVTIVAAHAIAGVCAGLGGILGSIEPAPARFGVGDTYLLPSVAAAVLGGVSVMGGRGLAIGAVAGALLISAIQILVEGAGLHYGWAGVSIGGLLIAALAAGSRWNQGADVRPRP